MTTNHNEIKEVIKLDWSLRSAQSTLDYRFGFDEPGEHKEVPEMYLRDVKG